MIGESQRIEMSKEIFKTDTCHYFTPKSLNFKNIATLTVCFPTTLLERILTHPILEGMGLNWQVLRSPEQDRNER